MHAAVRIAIAFIAGASCTPASRGPLAPPSQHKVGRGKPAGALAATVVEHPRPVAAAGVVAPDKTNPSAVVLEGLVVPTQPRSDQRLGGLSLRISRADRAGALTLSVKGIPLAAGVMPDTACTQLELHSDAPPGAGSGPASPGRTALSFEHAAREETFDALVTDAQLRGWAENPRPGGWFCRDEFVLSEDQRASIGAYLAKQRPAEARGPVGVAECDDYLRKYLACIETHAPEAVRAQIKTAVLHSTKGWVEAAASPEQREALRAACRAVLEAARRGTSAWGCEM